MTNVVRHIIRALNNLSQQKIYPIYSKFLYSNNSLFNRCKSKPHICLECAKHDYSAYGETFFHRIHQIPLISNCITHNFKLLTIDTYALHANFEILLSCDDILKSTCLVPSFQYFEFEIQKKIVSSLENKLYSYKTNILKALERKGYLLGGRQIKSSFFSDFELYLNQNNVSKFCIPFMIHTSRGRFKDYLNPFSLPSIFYAHCFCEGG